MRAIQIERTGGPDVLRPTTVEVGEPGPGEVRVRHYACGVNFIDTYHRTGLYPLPLPAILGVEGAGVVEAIGPGVTHIAVGNRVAYATPRPGSYAESRVLPAMPVVRIPDDLDFERAAALMLKGLTVQYLLRRTRPQRELEPGDFIVWHAAAGGVGLIACQWARALGFQLIATAGSRDKCDLALRHGAAHAIDYRTEDVVARVREITGNAGVKVVYDSVGKDTWERSLDCLQPLGLMVSFGNASGPVPPVNLGQLAAKGSLHVTRPTLFTHLATREVTDAMTAELFALVTAGTITIDPPRRYALDDAVQAHRDLEARSTTGSLVLVP
ncbi:MAG: quinone oxidoreductase [Deltaproteobacteria bacterium]|nr:quinone oxidoreductase [Deltaproteobacteria bacterium]MDQ3299576.1 quinone oxidoreductase [Myxococcota bacterium]